MKKKFIILLLFIPLLISATNRYVNLSGSGSGSGTIGDPFATLDEVSAISGSLVGGDTVFFNRGDVFDGYLSLGNITPTSQIVFTNYGVGAKPVISGFTTLNGGTVEGDGIISYTMPSGASQYYSKIVFDGELVPRGRSDSLTYDSATTLSITDLELGGSPDRTGQQIYVNVNDWIGNVREISDHTNNVITVSNVFDDNDESLVGKTPVGSAYFFQNDTSYLDELGEWAIRDGKVYVYFGSELTSNHIVKITSESRGVYLVNAPYHKFEHLRFEGTNLYGIYTNVPSCHHTIIDSCEIGFSGKGVSLQGYNSSITNTTIENCTDIGINSASYLHTIEENTINNIAEFIGLKMFDGGGMAIESRSDTSTISYNVINHTADDGISHNATYATISYNYIYDVNKSLIDGAGIYLFGQSNTNREVFNNIIIAGRAMGIYTDDASNGINIHGNFIKDFWRGIHIHNAYLNNYSNNTIYNCEILINAQTDTISDCIYLVEDNTIKNNICVAGINTEYFFNFRIWDCTSGVISDLGDMDNNIWIENGASLARFQTKEYGGGFQNDTHSEMIARYGFDANGSFDNTSTPIINYNATRSNKVVYSTDYSVTTTSGTTIGLTLLPYTSAVVLNVTDIQPSPFRGLYVIENGKKWIISE